MCPQGRSRSPAIPGGQKPLGGSVRFDFFWSQWWKDICSGMNSLILKSLLFGWILFYFTMNHRDFIADLGISSKWPKSFSWWSILASWTADVDGNAFPFIGLRGNMRCGRLFEMQKILTIQWSGCRLGTFFHAIFWWDERRSSDNLDLMKSGWLKKCLVRPQNPCLERDTVSEKYLLSILPLSLNLSVFLPHAY